MSVDMVKESRILTMSPETQENESSSPNEDCHSIMKNIVILTKLFEFMGFRDLCNCRRVCSNWKSVTDIEFRKRSRMKVFICKSPTAYETMNTDEIIRCSNELSKAFHNIVFPNANIPGAIRVEMYSDPMPNPVLANFMKTEKQYISEVIISVAHFIGTPHDFNAKLDVRNYIGEKNIWLTSLLLTFPQFVISVGDIPSIQNLDLWGCTINLDGTKISPKKVFFRGVKFIKDNEKCENTCINEFMNFDKMESLNLSGKTTDPELNIRLDMSKDKVTVDCVELQDMEVVWETAKWKVNRLHLAAVSFLQRTPMEIKYLNIKSTFKEIDLIAVPETVERIYLHETTLCSSTVAFPNLKYLNIWNTRCGPLLSHFSNCPNLTSLELTTVAKNFRIDVATIPKNVKDIKVRLADDWIMGNGQFHLNRLLIGWQSENVPDIIRPLEILKPEHLVIYGCFLIEGNNITTDLEMQTIYQLINGPFKSVAVGRMLWDSKILEGHPWSSFVDEISDYYLFEGGNGKAISKYQFEKLNTV